jgi:acyl dehydratase
MRHTIPVKGFQFEHAFEFSQENVARFAEVTGDNNPIHLNEAYAASTPFQKPIMHGFLSGSVFSKVFGTIYPGEGTIYLEQQMIFKRPMYAGQRYHAKFTVVDADPDKGAITVDCVIVDDNEKACLQGMARLLNKSVFQTR